MTVALPAATDLLSEAAVTTLLLHSAAVAAAAEAS
jgi:hypothetical protein